MSVVEEGKLAVEKALSHHGVKGMKWGVRKDAGGSDSKAVPVRTKVKPHAHMKTKVKTRGGRGHEAVPEAISTRQNVQILKKSGVNALTNDQLRVMQERLNLEQNVSRLAKTKQNKVAKQWVEGELKKEGSRRIGNWVAKDMAKSAAKKAAAAAALAA